jgi:large subunit ribosomal protein L16
MPLMPKRVKFRKQMRGKLRGNASRGNTLAYGDYGLQALEHEWMTARQIEAGRVGARQYLSRAGKFFVRVFPDKPISKKPLETRMGKGKAEPEYWAARVKPGTILYEVSGVPRTLAQQAFLRVAHKMPFKCRFVERTPQDAGPAVG